MTTRPTGAHPSPEEVDALLDPTGGDRSVAEHVSGCLTCADVRAALEEVRSLLKAEARRVPEPPADLDSRIAAALAGAVLQDEPQVAGVSALQARSAGSSADVVPLDSRRRGMPRWLAVAAGIAVVGGVGITTAQLVGDGLGGADNMTAGAARDADAPAAEAAPEQPEVLEDGGLQVVATGTDYGPDTLADQVDDLVAAVESGTATRVYSSPGEVTTEGQSDTAGQEGGVARLDSEAGVTACLEALEVGGRTPAAVDLATYRSAPVAVIVLPSDGGGLDVWVVSRSCGSGDEGLRQFTHVAP